MMPNVTIATENDLHQRSTTKLKYFEVSAKSMMQDSPTVIVLVGMIASGKSEWAQKHYYNFVRLDGDSLKTSPKMVKALKFALERGCSCVVDATNVTVERRKDIIDECQRYSIQHNQQIRVHCVIFKIPLPICMERRTKREADRVARGEPIAHIPDIAFYTLNKKYVEPTLAEGFAGITVIDFETTVEKSQPLSSGRRPAIRMQ
jgi:bifunctional polynucleotide phosphatase/kinase